MSKRQQKEDEAFYCPTCNKRCKNFAYFKRHLQYDINAECKRAYYSSPLKKKTACAPQSPTGYPSVASLPMRKDGSEGTANSAEEYVPMDTNAHLFPISEDNTNEEIDFGSDPIGYDDVDTLPLDHPDVYGLGDEEEEE